MTPSERMREIEKYAQMTPSALARHIGLKQNQTIYNIHHRGINISIALAKKITAVFPEIDTTWLLTGEGKMFVDGVEPTGPREPIDENPFVEVEEVQPLPIVDQDVMKQRNLNIFNYVGDNLDKVNKLRMGQTFDSANFVVSTYNESMLPNILPTDQLIVQRLNDPHHKIKEGEVYFVDTNSRGGLVRRCYYGAEKGVLECRADNYEVFPTLFVEEDDINDVGVILASVRYVIPSGLLKNYNEQMRESNAHISALIEQIDKARELNNSVVGELSKQGARIDELIQLYKNKQ